LFKVAPVPQATVAWSCKRMFPWLLMVRCESVFPALPPIFRAAPGAILRIPLPWMTPFVQNSALAIPSAPIQPIVPSVPSSSSVAETLPLTSHVEAEAP
jgi:hypothetical protein